MLPRALLRRDAGSTFVLGLADEEVRQSQPLRLTYGLLFQVLLQIPVGGGRSHPGQPVLQSVAVDLRSQELFRGNPDEDQEGAAVAGTDLRRKAGVREGPDEPDKGGLGLGLLRLCEDVLVGTRAHHDEHALSRDLVVDDIIDAGEKARVSKTANPDLIPRGVRTRNWTRSRAGQRDGNGTSSEGLP